MDIEDHKEQKRKRKHKHDTPIPEAEEEDDDGSEDKMMKRIVKVVESDLNHQQ